MFLPKAVYLENLENQWMDQTGMTRSHHGSGRCGPAHDYHGDKLDLQGLASAQCRKTESFDRMAMRLNSPLRFGRTEVLLRTGQSCRLHEVQGQYSDSLDLGNHSS